ncbi:hypothetical protein GH714_041720 [Hevea brasiliensis]|uniref:ditrans,polycis-polyprenyl diphosphate synthase [(2E,6E)-farnesyldiphosphate specific] n=1 Tax=Hevea brasiliensis TaxID=3981 RepID=A0A6A6MWV0_HEVBR|nr:hypothetical protein GH714_041720 [Hevea brasiliensis]
MDLKPGAGGQRVNRLVDPFAQISYHFLQFLWRTLHLLVSLWYLQVSMVQMIEGFLISSGLVKRYGALDIDKVRYLAIVVDSEEAYQISKVIQLLKWVEDMGVKHLCLYDSKGVLKTNKKTIMESLNNAMPFEEAVEKDVLLDQKQMTVEFASSSDGKEAITRAANAYGTLEVHEPRFTKKGHSQVHNSAAKLWYMSCLPSEIVGLDNWPRGVGLGFG